MKRTIAIISGLLLCLGLLAQDRQSFIDSYSRQVNRLGYAGVGVEGILNKWEAAFPDDGLMMEARSAYYMAKSRSSQVITLDKNKYLGAKPVLSLPDSTGKVVNYFEDYVYDPDCFAKAMEWIDKAIALYPRECCYSFDKVTALVEYEKMDPELASDLLIEMVDKHLKDKDYWLTDGEAVAWEDFSSAVQEYCYKLYLIGSERSYETFRIVSEKMAKAYPKEVNYLTNLGSYYLIVRQNDKKALLYYTKALKIDPEDPTAKNNIQVIERRAAQAKKKK